MNRKARALLVGMTIGDGCLKLKPRNYVEFVLAHSEKQRPYLEHKLEVLHSIMGGKKPKIRETTTTLSSGKTYKGFVFSKQHKYLKLLRRWLYNANGKKEITDRILGYLDDQGLAYWYMDDGSLTVNLNQEGKVSSFEVRLYTYCSLEEALTIQKFFKERYDIQVKVSKYGKKQQYNIKMNTTEGRKFLDVVYPYKVDCMAYKFDILSETRVRNISYRDDDIV